MKSESVENIVVDETHGRAYVVMADRNLTDGELYRAIRVELLRRGHPPARGERLVIPAARQPRSKTRSEPPGQPHVE